MNSLAVQQKLSSFVWDGTVYPKMDPFVEKNAEIFMGDYRVSSVALSRVAKHLGVAYPFVERCPVDIQVDIMNFFYDRMGSVIALVERNNLVNFVDIGADLLSPFDVIDIIADTVEDTNFNKVQFSKDLISIDSSGVKQSEVTVGDIVNHGVSVTFNPWTSTDIEVTGYMNRLVCSNGMLGSEDLSVFKKGRNGGNAYDWLRKSIDGAYSFVGLEVDRLRDLIAIELNGNRNEAIEHVLMQIPSRMREVVRYEIMQKNPKNMYDLTCIMTEIGTHRIDNYHASRTLMGIGGTLIRHFEHCPVCKRVM